MPNPAKPYIRVSRIKAAAGLTRIEIDTPFSFSNPAHLADLKTQLESETSLPSYVFNVRAYGATGDGITDDHDAIALAIVEWNAAGGVLYFPPGVYVDSGSHTLSGPAIEHPSSEIEYQGNWAIVGDGTASVWKYTGAGVFLDVAALIGPPSNVVIKDIQIKGPSPGPVWDGTSVGLDITSTGVDFQLDNVTFCDWGKIGMRAWDMTSFGANQVSFRHCKLGLAGDYKFDGVVLDRCNAQNCDVGIDLGYYNPTRTYSSSPPQVESVVLSGCVFGANRIGLIVGGAATRGVTVIGAYFESQTDASIDLGHNATDYSGLAKETSAGPAGVTVVGCYFQETCEIFRVWCPVSLTTYGNSFNGPTAPIIRCKNALADISAFVVGEVVTNGVGYFGGSQKTTPLNTLNTRFTSFLTIDSAEVAPLILAGPTGGFPGAQLVLAEVIKGYWVSAGVAGAFFLDAQIGDMIFRSEAGTIRFGVGAGNSVLTIDAGRVAATVPIVYPSYVVAELPSAATYARGMIYVSNESGGAVMAFSDGTNWRRVTDRAIIT